MAEGFDRHDDYERYDENDASGNREELFSKVVRAGKRTYFMDVRATRRGDYYMTITESKKRLGRDGRFHFEKHKIFLYKEDFEKYMEGLNETIKFIQANQPEFISPGSHDEEDF